MPPVSATTRTTSPRKRGPHGKPPSAGTPPGPTSSQSGGSPKFERSEQQRIDRAHLALHDRARPLQRPPLREDLAGLTLLTRSTMTQLGEGAELWWGQVPGDGPLSVRGCPSGQQPRARPEPARTGLGLKADGRGSAPA